MKETQWKTQSFHLGHESISRAALLSSLHVFSPQMFRGSSSGLKRRMYWFWHVYFHGKDILSFSNKTGTCSFVVHVFIGTLSVAFMAGFLSGALTDMDYCSLRARISCIYFILCSSCQMQWECGADLLFDISVWSSHLSHCVPANVQILVNRFLTAGKSYLLLLKADTITTML